MRQKIKQYVVCMVSADMDALKKATGQTSASAALTFVTEMMLEQLVCPEEEKI